MEQEILEILRRYQYALIWVGVDFSHEDVQEALQESFDGFEDALRTVISYWKRNGEYIEEANSFLIKALRNFWRPYVWDDQWMQDSRFIPPSQKWWKEAENHMGRDLRNWLVVDVVEHPLGASSVGYIVFRNGQTLSLETAKRLGWERLIEYAKENDS